MRRLLFPVLVAAAAAGCVSVEPMPDPHGALKKGQRLVVIVNQSPGPWLIDAADSKAAAAAKISPLGFFVQSVQDNHTLETSKVIQQYLPRPHYGLEVRDALLKSLKTNISSSSVQTGVQAGISIEQLEVWNKSTDQLDWRQRFYYTDPEQPAPRDYAKILTLDDALILDVNISFGTTAAPTDDGNIIPQMSAASRVYRGDTAHMIWQHEDEVTDQASSSTLADFELQPVELTSRLEKLAPTLGSAVGLSFTKAFGLLPSTSTPRALSTGTVAGASGGGLLSMSYLQSLSSAPPAGLLPQPAFAAPASTATVAVAASTSVVSGVAASSAAAGVALSTAAASSAKIAPEISSTTSPTPEPPLPGFGVSSGTVVSPPTNPPGKP